LLGARGAQTVAWSAAEQLIAACMGGEADRVAALRAQSGVVDAALALEPGAIRRAAGLGRRQGVQLLAGLGFDVSERNRSTALHEAARLGDREMARALLSLGADPTIHDTEFNGMPAGWAHHCGFEELAVELDAAAKAWARGH
jgi:ankyrin repeat protein